MTIFHVSFFVYHFYCHFSPRLWSKFILLYDFVEDLFHHYLRLVVACFDVFSSEFVAVCKFACFESVDCSFVNSSVVISRFLIISHVSFFGTSMLLSVSFSPFSCSVSSCSWSSKLFCRILPNTMAIPYRDGMTSLFSFFVLVMSTLLFADLIPWIF